MFGMLNVLMSIPSCTQGPGASPSVELRGMSSPFTAYQFGSGHIPASTLLIGGCPPPPLVLTLVFILLGVVLDM